MSCCLPVVMCFLPQCIEFDFKLIFDGIPVEKLPHMARWICGWFSCERVALSPLHLRGNTQLCYRKSGLVLQISWRALLRGDTPIVLVNVLISQLQNEVASHEMLDTIVQDDVECAIERWGGLSGTSFWDGHFVLILVC